MTYLEQTIALIKARSMSIKTIVQDTGICKASIENIASGRTANPGVLSVQALHNYLSAHP